MLRGEMEVTGRKEKGSKKGGMGSKERQRAKVLFCDTRERKMIRDLVMWMFPKAISIVWDRVTPLM